MSDDLPEATRKSVEFDLNEKDESGDDEKLLDSIKENFEQNLFQWDSFPLVLPSPIRSTSITIRPSDLLKFPKFNDELDDLAIDSNGNSKRLNETQLKQIRANGEFQIESKTFPGQRHKWKLSRFLQKGYESGRKTLRKALAFALKIIIIFAKDRFVGKTFSIRKALRAWWKIPQILVDVIIGWPNNQPIEFEELIQTERLNFLISELKAPEGSEYMLDNFREFIFRLKNENPELRYLENEHFPKLLYQFAVNGSDDISIDFRLRNRSIRNQLQILLPKIIAEQRSIADRQWFIDFRNASIKELKEQNLEHNEIEKITQQRVHDEFMKQLYNAIRENEEIEEIGSGLGALLVSTYKFHSIVIECAKTISKELEDLLEKTRTDLTNQYPIRSLIGRWMRRCIKEKEETFKKENKWKLYKMVLEKLDEKKEFDQFSYFIRRDMEFMEKREPQLRAELSILTEPTRTFNWGRHILMARHFIVTRHDPETGEKTRIEPNRFSDVPYEHNYSAERPSSPSYDLQKHYYYSHSTRYPFWRWVNLGYRYYIWTWNAIYFLLHKVPWCSSLGFRALVSPQPFFPKYVLNQIGTLCPDRSSKTHSFVSRMRALWRHIHKSRVSFESAPDRGFLGKSVTRPLNMFWNYVIKGAFGSVILTLIFPALCIVVPTGSVILGLTSPIWMLGVVLFYYLFCAFIYDKDSPNKRKYHGMSYCQKKFHRHQILPFFDLVLFRFVTLGVLQPICAFTFASVVCPVGSLLVTVFAFVRHGLRSFWDLTMFHILIKRFGRLPATDSFVARRVAGPGLSRDFFYQIEPVQALSVVECEIESAELRQYQRETELHLNQPIAKFNQRVETIFGPFGGQINTDNKQYQRMVKTAQDLRHKLAQMVEKRQKPLTLVDIAHDKKSRIRLTGADLTFTLEAAGYIVENLYPKRVLARMDQSEEEFWKGRDLQFRDWKGLAGQILEKVFGSHFLEPLEETEKRFQLQVHHIDMKEYLNQLLSAEHREDLDSVTPHEDHQRSKYSIYLPSVNVDQFNSFYRPGFQTNLGQIAKPFQNRPELPSLPILMSIIHNNTMKDKSEISYDSSFCSHLFGRYPV